MRARELAFKGDMEMLVGSRHAIREEFQKNANASEGQRKLPTLCHSVRALDLPGTCQIAPFTCIHGMDPLGHALKNACAFTHLYRSVKALLLDADEAEDMLRHQLVQGTRKGDGEYELNVETRHTSLDPNQAPGAK